jgi:ribosomal protein L33
LLTFTGNWQPRTGNSLGDVMAKESRENVWMQCTSCNDLNYRTEIKVAGGVQKIELMKFCKRERSHKLHKIKRK